MPSHLAQFDDRRGGGRIVRFLIIDRRVLLESIARDKAEGRVAGQRVAVDDRPRRRADRCCQWNRRLERLKDLHREPARRREANQVYQLRELWLARFGEEHVPLRDGAKARHSTRRGLDEIVFG